MGLIISITNHKGGVAKTTTAISLSHALAREGKKVLAVDLDLQCNLTTTLIGNRRLKGSLYDLLNPVSSSVAPQDTVISTKYNRLYLVPNVEETAAIERPLIELPHGQSFMMLRTRFRKYAKENFDYTLIDCPPNLGAFVINALVASDCVIIPTEAGSRFSVEGLSEAVNFIEDIRSNGNPDLTLLKVLLTKADMRYQTHKAVMRQIRNHYPEERVFETFIPINVDLQKAELMRKTILEFKSHSRGAKAYKKVAREIIEITENGRGTE